MRVDRGSLTAQYDAHSDERLAEIAASGDYSEEARSVARELLLARGSGGASAPSEAENASDAAQPIGARPRRPDAKGPPPSRATLLLIALPMVLVSLAGMWWRAQERERRNEEFHRHSEDAYDQRMGVDEIDPETMALVEAAARGEVMITADGDGHVLVTPIARDGGRNGHIAATPIAPDAGR